MQKASKSPSLKCSLLTVIPAKLERYQDHKSQNEEGSHKLPRKCHALRAKEADPMEIITSPATEATAAARVQPHIFLQHHHESSSTGIKQHSSSQAETWTHKWTFCLAQALVMAHCSEGILPLIYYISLFQCISPADNLFCEYQWISI